MAADLIVFTFVLPDEAALHGLGTPGLRNQAYAWAQSGRQKLAPGIIRPGPFASHSNGGKAPEGRP
jgi:hypothetical protein